MEKAILLLSGGLDSATLLWLMRSEYEVHALTLRHGRSNKMEVRSSKALAKRGEAAEHIIVDLEILLELDEYKPGGGAILGVPPSYIPARNAVLFAIAAHYAELREASMIFTGQNMDDKFPDSGQDFLDAFNSIITMGRPARLKQGTRVIAPFIAMRKVDIYRLAKRLGVPIDLTWSCHRDGQAPCGSCEGCITVSRSKREAEL
jgi:7-cyano-7-deazaguanine synthase